MKRGIITKLFSPSRISSTMMPVADGYANLLVVLDPWYEAYEIFHGIPISQLIQMTDITAENYTLNDQFLNTMSPIGIELPNEEMKIGREIINLEKSLWSLLRDLIAEDAQVIIHGKSYPLRNINASRSTDNVYIRYKNDVGEFKTEVLANLKQANNDKKIFFDVQNEQLLALPGQYTGVTNENRVLQLQMPLINKLSANLETFYSFICPELLLSLTWDIEYSKICKRAAWFSLCICQEILGFEEEALGPVETVRRSVQRECSELLFDVNCTCPSQAELKGLIYGSSATFFINIIKTQLGNTAQLQKTMREWFPQSGMLYHVFRTIFCDLTSKITRNTTIAELAALQGEYMQQCNKDIAMLSMSFYELKSMMLEYEYYPELLLRGVSLNGVRLQIKRGG